MIPTNSSEAELDMTYRAQEVLAEQNTPTPPKETVDPKVKKRNVAFRQKIDVCKNYRRKLTQNWTVSIDYRRMKPFASQSDDDQVAVPLDWALTKTKQASLFSQIPQVRISHAPDTTSAGPWLAQFERRLNDTLVTAGIEAAMYEAIPDCINASGIGVVLVSYESITEDREVPATDLSSLPPEIHSQVLQSGKMPDGSPVPMEVVPYTLDKRYVVSRVSPADFLWEVNNFAGSNFDNGPWIGRSGRLPWEEAARKFKLSEADREKVMGEDRTVLDKLTYDVDKDKIQEEQMVGFDEVFFKVHQFDSEAKSYSTIHHLVFVNGKDDPVIDEPWKGQRINEEDGSVLGATKFPIRVLSLAYLTDESIPPSDSAIGRAQVNEINKARGQMIRQRERNIPVRWADPNRIDPAIMHSLMRGTWGGFIPIAGDGSRAIGEVAKTSHPPEDFSFDQISKNDLNEAWSIGPNQLGSGAGVETKGESGEIAAHFQTRVGQERARVATFVTGIAEVLGGLMCLYEDPEAFGEEFDPSFAKALTFSILPDSTVLLDANQKLQRYNSFLNEYAKSGYVALEPVLKEIATLSGLDPGLVIKAPDPKPPAEPNISLRLTGKDDLMNPLVLAFLMGTGQFKPDPQLLEQAKQILQATVVDQPPAPPPPEGGPAPETPPTPVGEANPDATILPTITKRSEDPASVGGAV